MTRLRCLVLVFTGMAALAILTSATGTGPTIHRASEDSAGNEANRESIFASASADGRYVVFQSPASNLVPTDTHGVPQIYLKDMQTGAISLVSADATGTPGNSQSTRAVISHDGRYVVFNSVASNFVADDTNQTFDVFVKDIQTGEIELESVDSSGVHANDQSDTPTISSDGRYVAFQSLASNLVAGDTNGTWDTFVHDRQTGITERASVDSAGNQGNNYTESAPAISDDGRYVAFQSNSSNLVPGDTNVNPDVFVHDRLTGETKRVSLDSSGAQLSHGGAQPDISADGRYIAFGSSFFGGIFVRDLQTNQTESVPMDNSLQYAVSSLASISSDGRYVAFNSSVYDQLTGGYRPNQIFVYDRASRRLAKISINASGAEGDGGSFSPDLSPSGESVAFYSFAENLVSTNENQYSDAYVSHLGDMDADSILDPFDNCPTTPNADQANAVHPGTPAGDACEDFDGDGFTDARETFIGTDPNVACAATSAPDDEAPPDAWPADFNNDQAANLTDIFKIVPHLNTLDTDPGSSQRFDLNGDGSINLTDIFKVVPFLNFSCAP